MITIMGDDNRYHYDFFGGVLVADGGAEVDSSDGGVPVACWGSRVSFRFFLGVRGVVDCDDCRGAGGG